MTRFAARFEPPYYAVIFSSQRDAVADDGYEPTAEHIFDLATQQPGYLGAESTRDASGLGITVSYWRTLEDIAAWRRQAEHTAARNEARARWYSHYELRIAKVEKSYGWDRADGKAAGDGGL